MSLQTGGRRNRQQKREEKRAFRIKVIKAASLCLICGIAIYGVFVLAHPAAAPDTLEPKARSSAAETPDAEAAKYAVVLSETTAAPMPLRADFSPWSAVSLPFKSSVPRVSTMPTPAPAPTPYALRSATIRTLGDFVIHEPVFRAAKIEGNGTYDFAPMLEMVKHVISGADYTVANVDGSLGGPGERGYQGYPRFNTPPALMQALAECGVDMLTLANNHALDEYFDGLKATIENCEKYGLDHVGGARTPEEHDKPVIIEIAGISVGFLNYTFGTNAMERFCNKNVIRYGINYISKAYFKRDARALRDAGAEVIVAYMHWGDEYNRKANASQKANARKLAEAGVDVIVGGHPHVVQSPIEWIKAKQEDGTSKQTLCVYSIGNFLSNQPQRYRDGGIVFEFTIQEIREGAFEMRSPKYIPTYYWRRGSEKKGLTIRVVACGEWMEERPEGMNDDSYARLKQIWGETHSLLGDNAAEISIN